MVIASLKLENKILVTWSIFEGWLGQKQRNNLLQLKDLVLKQSSEF